jgi:hypothetical protein
VIGIRAFHFHPLCQATIVRIISRMSIIFIIFSNIVWKRYKVLIHSDTYIPNVLGNVTGSSDQAE